MANSPGRRRSGSAEPQSKGSISTLVRAAAHAAQGLLERRTARAKVRSALRRIPVERMRPRKPFIPLSFLAPAKSRDRDRPAPCAFAGKRPCHCSRGGNIRRAPVRGSTRSRLYGCPSLPRRVSHVRFFRPAMSPREYLVDAPRVRWNGAMRVPGVPPPGVLRPAEGPGPGSVWRSMHSRLTWSTPSAFQGGGLHREGFLGCGPPSCDRPGAVGMRRSRGEKRRP
jgi:hypothetical protein